MWAAVEVVDVMIDDGLYEIAMVDPVVEDEPPPPPPPLAPSQPEQEPVEVEEMSEVIRELEDEVEKEVAAAAADPGVESGAEGGVEDGEVGGAPAGIVGAAGDGPPTVATDVLEVKKRVEPKYPKEAKNLNLGDQRCVAVVTVGKDGAPISVTVEECPKAFHEATIDALVKWRWYPPRIDGKTLQVRTQIAVRYTTR